MDNGFFEKFGTLLQEQSQNGVADGDSGVGDEASPDSSLDAQDTADATADLIEDAMGWNVSRFVGQCIEYFGRRGNSDSQNEDAVLANRQT